MDAQDPNAAGEGCFPVDRLTTSHTQVSPVAMSCCFGAPSEVATSPSAKAQAVLKAHKAHGIITPAQAALGSALVAAGQAHLFANWPNTGSDDAHKQRLMAQVESIDGNYAGGLMAYIANAKELLEASRAGLNPLEGWTPAVPQGKTLAYGDAEFTACEARGMQEVGAAAFVLVAGGLGERLGFSGIKVALPVESTTNECFLGMYCRSILALQAAAAAAGSSRKLPLAIMTSGDTHQRTEALLKANEYFGMSPDQVTLMKQEKVPCLADNNAALALAANDAYTIQTKPHGHGDVHMLLHSTGLLKQWKAQGVSWVCFFQDTNALVFRAITAALGVSAAENFEVNSLAVPRKAKEAIGGIARLDNAAGDSMTLNVEYNQLDPLLRATINAEGDVNDPATGHSPFPGNINQLVLALEPYEAQLQVTGGAIAEFVNPKYKNAERTEFKAPTRLECMMQDYPKSLGKQARVGFTTLEVWAAYSPVKNSPDEGRGKAKGGSPSHTATSGELDVYMANCRLLEMAGAKVEAPKRVQYNGLELMQPASVVLSPAFAVSLAAVKAKVTCKSRMGVKVSQRSTLVLDGEDIELRGLQLDGALLVTAVPGAKVIIDGLKVHNDGYVWTAVDETDAALPEVDRIRGFKLVASSSVRSLLFDKPGTYHVKK